jgi:hypothetical protein
MKVQLNRKQFDNALGVVAGAAARASLPILSHLYIEAKSDKPYPRWEDNIMAARNKPVQQRNIDEFCQLAKKWKAWHVIEK